MASNLLPMVPTITQIGNQVRARKNTSEEDVKIRIHKPANRHIENGLRFKVTGPYDKILRHAPVDSSAAKIPLPVEAMARALAQSSSAYLVTDIIHKNANLTGNNSGGDIVEVTFFIVRRASTAAQQSKNLEDLFRYFWSTSGLEIEYLGVTLSFVLII